MNDSNAQSRDINITRIVDAPRDVVFNAWVDPAMLAQWFSPQGFSTTDVKVDTQVGGKWELVMVEEASGERFPNKSTLLEITPPERLVLSDSWEPMGVEAEDTIVTVTFEETDGKTRLTVHASPMPDNEFAEGAPQGWAETLDKLEKLVTS